MELLEAAQLVGLEAGKKYRAGKVNSVIKEAERLEQRRGRNAFSVQDREKSKVNLSRITEAGKVLRNHIKGGYLKVPSSAPAAATAAPSARPRPRAASPAGGRASSSPVASRGRTGVPAVDAIRGIGSFVPRLGHAAARGCRSKVAFQLASAAGSFARGLYCFLAGILGLILAPPKLVKNKEYLEALLVVLFVGSLSLSAFYFTTGDIHNVVPVIQRGSKNLHNVMHRIIQGEDISREKGSGTADIEIDVEDTSFPQEIGPGSYKVNVSAGSDILYSGKLHLPGGGRVEMEEKNGELQLIITWSGGSRWVALNTLQK